MCFSRYRYPSHEVKHACILYSGIFRLFVRLYLCSVDVMIVKVEGILYTLWRMPYSTFSDVELFPVPPPPSSVRQIRRRVDTAQAVPVQLWFDFDSTLVWRARPTVYKRSLSAQWCNRLTAVPLTCLFRLLRSVASRHIDDWRIGRRMGVARWNRGRIAVEWQSNRSRINHCLIQYVV